MASAASSTDPMKQVPLSDAELLARRDVLVSRIKERDELEEQKRLQTGKWNESLKLLDEQISTVATEIREKRAWVPAQFTGGEGMGVPPGDDHAVEPDDTVADLTERRNRRSAKKKTSRKPS